MSVVIGEFPGGSVVKNLPASAGDGDSIPGLERSSLKFEELSIFAWRIPWTGEPGRLQPMGPQRVGCTKKRVQFGGNASICRSRPRGRLVLEQHTREPTLCIPS